MSYYVCAECGEPIEGADVEDRHSTPAGEDCHATCCLVCYLAAHSNFSAALDSFQNFLYKVTKEY
jgi:hypothetical protein